MAPVESLSQALHDAAHETEPDVAAAVHRGLERGRRMRRSRRIAQVAGSTAAIVAVGTASVFVAGAHDRHAVSPHPPTGTPTPTSNKTPTSHKTAQDPYLHSSDKVLDIRMHLPALLQQILPSGTTIAAAPKDWETVSIAGATLAVTNATGTSAVNVNAMPLDEASASTGPDHSYCKQSHNATEPCPTLKVPGGTIYVADEDRTALDEAGGQAPAGQFLPGHEKDVVWRTQQLTFVPDDNSRPYFELYETTQAEAVPYVNTPPAGTDGHLWPPAAGTVKGPTATGLPITPDAFAAMVGKPQISQIEQLYDNDVPASQSAVDARNGINAQVAALAAPVLPPGLKITVNYSESAHAVLVLTGPSGTNGLDWYTDTRSHMLQSNNDLKCQPDDHDCQTQKVPGGTVQWANWFGKAQPDELEYVPDDPNGTAVAIHLNPTGSSSEEMNAIPGSKYAPPQLTHDQLLALATSPGIADIIHATNLLGR